MLKKLSRLGLFRLTATAALLVIISSSLWAQHPGWQQFSDGKHINCQLLVGDTNWIGTPGGLMKLNINTGETEFFNNANSGLPFNWIRGLAVDSSGALWLATDDGIASFDGVNWFVYNSDNSGLPYNRVCGVAVDADQNIWIATGGGGLAVFDGSNWTV